jgi:hypothetical protein
VPEYNASTTCTFLKSNCCYRSSRLAETSRVVRHWLLQHTKNSDMTPSLKSIWQMAGGQGIFIGIPGLPKNFRTTPAVIFGRPSISKINKYRRLFLVKLMGGSIQVPKGCCTFQLSLVYNRVCWGFVWCGCGLFSFEKWASGPLGIFRGIFLGPGGWPGWFLRGFGVREARGGSFGVTNPKRDILVAV